MGETYLLIRDFFWGGEFFSENFSQLIKELNDFKCPVQGTRQLNKI